MKRREFITLIGGPRTTMMGGTIASPWRYETAAFHARYPLEHVTAGKLALRPWAAVFRCHGRLGKRAAEPSQEPGKCLLSGETRKKSAPFEYFAV
jgi:hypothetical protein